MVMPNHWKPPCTDRLPSTNRIPCPCTPLMFASPTMCTIGKYEPHGCAGLTPSPQLVVTGSTPDRKSTRLNSSHDQISYAVFCLKKKKKQKKILYRREVT